VIRYLSKNRKKFKKKSKKNLESWDAIPISDPPAPQCPPRSFIPIQKNFSAGFEYVGRLVGLLEGPIGRQGHTGVGSGPCVAWPI
jgi:hypothetical protein